MGVPEPHVDGDGGDLGSDSEDDGGPVAVADEESGERGDVVFGVGAEGAGGGVGYGHLGERSHEKEGDEGADGVGDEDGRACEADGKGAAEEEAGSDGSADGDHGELGGGEGLLETLFAVGDVSEGAGLGGRHVAGLV